MWTIKKNSLSYSKRIKCLITTFFSADGHIQDFIIQRWDIQYFTLESLVAMDDVTVNNAKLHIHVPHKGSSDTISTRRPRNITLDNESRG